MNHQNQKLAFSELTGPKIDTPRKELSLHSRQTQIRLNQSSCFGTDSNVITQITRIHRCAQGKEKGGSSDWKVTAKVAMVLSFVRLFHYWSLVVGRYRHEIILVLALRRQRYGRHAIGNRYRSNYVYCMYHFNDTFCLLSSLLCPPIFEFVHRLFVLISSARSFSRLFANCEERKLEYGISTRSIIAPALRRSLAVTAVCPPPDDALTTEGRCD